jgi:capsular polysaccharide biosynthesis protein
MELMLILRVLRRRWWLALIPVIVAAVLVLPGFLNRGPALSGGFTTVIRYSAAHLLESPAEPNNGYQDIWQASEWMVDTLAEWTLSNTFKQEIAQAAAGRGLTIDPNALAIAADNENVVAQLFISWTDADQLETIAQSAIDVLQTRSSEYLPQLAGQPAAVRVLGTPQIAPAPPPLVDRFGPFLRIGLGLLAGIGLAFLAEYLDPTLRRREQVEALGLPIIASIPRH